MFEDVLILYGSYSFTIFQMMFTGMCLLESK